MQTGPKVGIGIATIRRSRRMVQASEPLLLVVALLSVAILGGCTGIVSASKPTGSTTGAFQLTPATLNFGNVAVGKQSSQTVTVSNTGSTSVTIMQATVSNSQFTVSGVSLPMTMASGQSANFTIGVKPTVTGALNGTLTVQGDNSSGSGTVNLAATVTAAANPQISLSSNSINFGSVTVGSSGSSSLTISNTGGSDLTISSVSLTGTGFGISGITTPKVISAGQSSVVSLTFSPAATGAASGSLAISSSDPANPTLHVNLSGTGVTTTLTLSFSSTNISFGSVNTGTPATQSETITNTGNSNVQISKITVSGTGYSLSGAGAPVTLSPSQQLTFSVIFDPTTAGSASGSILVTSNATGSPTTIALSGSGVVAVSHTVSLTWVASTTSAVTGYNVYRSTTSGGGFVKVGSASGLSYTDSTVQNSTTYYYVTTAVDSIGDESVYSNEATAVIP